MRASGRFQRLIWRLRLELRKSETLRAIVRFFRHFGPDTRDWHLRGEVGFWRRWLASEGLSWPEDYRMRLDPQGPVQQHLAGLIDRLPGATIEILDVGAGPVTVVGKAHPSKKLSITATDVLAAEYNTLLDEFAVEPPVRTIYAEAEKLREQLADRQFDIVHAQNSLDHCADPFAAIEEMLALTRPGGFVALFHEENEGQNELYHALHKWDFACERGRFTIAGPGPNAPRRDVTALVSGRADVECSTDDGMILVIMRRLPTDGRRKRQRSGVVSS
jgi:SAM-dependent methyltransferase